MEASNMAAQPKLTSTTTEGSNRSQSSAPLPRSRRFECTYPECGKQFARKEHLNRHLKQHQPHAQYQCPRCEKRFVRSDVLKRHIDQHPRMTDLRRTLIACESCRERKIKCDDDQICGPCNQGSIQCVRLEPGRNKIAYVHGTGDRHDDEEYVPLQQPVGTMEINTLHNVPLDGHNISHKSMWPSSHNGSTPEMQHFDSILTQVALLENPVLPENLHWNVGDGLQPQEIMLPTISTSEPQSILILEDSKESASVFDFSLQHIDNSRPQTPQAGLLSSDSTAIEDIEYNSSNSTSQASQSMTRFIDVFFDKVHPCWPILHKPTFSIEATSHTLLMSMVMLASHFDGGEHHLKISQYVFGAVLSAHLDPHISIQDLQASAFAVIYTLQCITSEGMLAKAHHLMSVLISSCRWRRIFDESFPDESNATNPFLSWVRQEQVHRLAFTVLQIDAYFSVLTHHPPSIRYQEMYIPLPKSNQLWCAENDEERLRIVLDEPVSHGTTTFATIMRNALDHNPENQDILSMSISNYHLGLCAMQAGVSQAVHEAHSAASDNDAGVWSAAYDTLQVWESHLNLWRHRMKIDCQLINDYFAIESATQCDATPHQSLMLWHISSLKMHTPLDLLQVQASDATGGSSKQSSTHRTKARLRTWFSSMCPRIAVWNAAQIMRIVVHESRSRIGRDRLRLNPLAASSLLMSTLATCVYARFTRACPSCTSNLSTAGVDIFNCIDTDQTLVRWKDAGEGFAIWGPSGLPVCQCQYEALFATFQQSQLFKTLAGHNLTGLLERFSGDRIVP